MIATSIFDLAAARMHWLATRQTAIASNIANADTPGYRAQDVTSFQSMLQGDDFPMATTSPLHMTGSDLRADVALKAERPAWDADISGNDVSIDQEMTRAGETTSQYSLASNVMRSFQGMWLLAAKG